MEWTSQIFHQSISERHMLCAPSYSSGGNLGEDIESFIIVKKKRHIEYHSKYSKLHSVAYGRSVDNSTMKPRSENLGHTRTYRRQQPGCKSCVLQQWYRSLDRDAESCISTSYRRHRPQEASELEGRCCSRQVVIRETSHRA